MPTRRRSSIFREATSTITQDDLGTAVAYHRATPWFLSACRVRRSRGRGTHRTMVSALADAVREKAVALCRYAVLHSYRMISDVDTTKG
jgi:hypothetical protein